MTDRQQERLVRERLAARMHQRQAALLRRSLALTRRLRRLYAEAAKRIAARAAKDGTAGIGDFERTIDGELRGVASELRRELAAVAVEAHRLTRKAMMDAVPLWWLAAYARRRVLPVREREDRDAAAEMQILADLDRALELPKAEAKALVQSLLFPPPSPEAVDAMLSAPGPGGIPWDDRLRHWERGTRDAMRRELSAGVGAGANVAGLEKRLRPLADGMSYKAQRIARTEAARVGHRMNEAAYDAMGDAVEAKILSSVMDEFTRPEHAVRNGRRFVRGADGVYRDGAGNVIPDLPDAPNCRCGVVPDLGMPEYLRQDPGARAAYEKAAADLVPDPASYADWWQQAGERERMTAVGVRRYHAAEKTLGRKPDWPDLLDPEGKLLSVERIRGEAGEDREQRLRRVSAMLTQRKAQFAQAASGGFGGPAPPDPVPPPATGRQEVHQSADIAEAERWALENVPGLRSCNFSGMDLDVANATASAASQIARRFGIEVPKIGSMQDLGYRLTNPMAADAPGIGINKAHWTGNERAILERWLVNSRHRAGCSRDAYSYVAHEMAHVLHARSPRASSLRSVVDKYRRSMKQSGVREELGGYAWDANGNRNAIPWKETWAEAFSAWWSDRASCSPETIAMVEAGLKVLYPGSLP